MTAVGHINGVAAAIMAAVLYFRLANSPHARKLKKNTIVSIRTSLVLCTKSGSVTAKIDVAMMLMREYRPHDFINHPNATAARISPIIGDSLVPVWPKHMKSSSCKVGPM